jgi:IS605 OrfB family transposase
MLVRGKWYLACVCDVADPDRIGIEDVLGVDFGIVNLALGGQRRPCTGAAVEKVRQKLSCRRAGLQRCGSKAAKPKLKKLSGKEARSRKHANHCISKEIVANAKRSCCAIAIEDLTHIRRRVKATRAQRNRLHGWSFNQLRQFVTYKARLSGVPVIAVAPRNTSRRCPECGFNRKTQTTFSCAVRLLPPPPISLETFGRRGLRL